MCRLPNDRNCCYLLTICMQSPKASGRLHLIKTVGTTWNKPIFCLQDLYSAVSAFQCVSNAFRTAVVQGMEPPWGWASAFQHRFGPCHGLPNPMRKLRHHHIPRRQQDLPNLQPPGAAMGFSATWLVIDLKKVVTWDQSLRLFLDGTFIISESVHSYSFICMCAGGYKFQCYMQTILKSKGPCHVPGYQWPWTCASWSAPPSRARAWWANLRDPPGCNVSPWNGLKQ